MNRRDTVIALAALGAAPLAALAQSQGKVWRIGYLTAASPEPAFGYFKEGLRRLGYVQGENIQIEFRSAEGKSERLAGLAAELVGLKVEVIVVTFTAAMFAAKRATSQIPIVLAGAGDPVGTGLIASLSRPGGNITGTSATTAELGGKLLQLIREALPAAKRVAVLANPADPFHKPFLEQIQAAGGKMKLEISPIMLRDADEIDAAFTELVKRRPDFVIIQPSLPRRRAAEIALKHRLPTVAPNGAFPDEGGLMSYASSLTEMFHGAAVYVDKILKGAKPTDLPVQQPTIFELTINLKTAKALGIKIPQSVLVRADRVIE